MYIRKWGTQGSGDGQFIVPYGVDVDPDGNVFVVEFGNARVQKFTGSGAFVTKWGSPGSADGQFLDPFRVTTDAAGAVYVCDAGNNRIQKFDSNGNFLLKWGTAGSGDGQFDHAGAVAIAPDGILFVTDVENHRVREIRELAGERVPGDTALSDGDQGALRLSAWPNPFSQRIAFGFSLGPAGEARIRVFGPDGAQVRAHAIASRGAGESPTTSAWEWDGRDGDGRALASGVYFVQVEAGGLRTSRKVVLAR